MDFKEYIKEVDRLYYVGNTTEHSFRGALASYLQTLLKNYVVTNEPRRIDCGAPDYVITLKEVPVAFLEAKDINDNDLDGRKDHKDQFNRYKESLDRIIFTDYLDFHMYIGGEFVDSVRIAETKGDHVVGIPGNESKFNEMILHLATEGRQRITSSAALAKRMAAKAHLLAEAVLKRIKKDGEDGTGDMPAQLRAFRNVLIHDLRAEEFADIYAQTIAYGMFTARLNDTTPDDFSRQEAASLIPKSNPFLRKIFYNIAGIDLDEGIAWIVDDLASMFAATDSERIMRNYGSNKRHSDPIVHFYEDFLAEYDPSLRKSRGVWYTPAPVVKFIVRAVDDILQTEFKLPMGLADDSKIKVDYAIEQSTDGRTVDGKKHEMREVHRVQILDPATGTGTFLAEIIQQVRDKFDGMEGMWPSYVEKNLIPRLHGFEILMASYTIAHLKLSMTLKSTGYENQANQRLKVFLTNSLEEATPRADNLFSNWLSDEADEASLVKSKAPIMIALGNPPYSGASQNKGAWIAGLMDSYKKEPGGVETLKERNPKWINNDYVKFIRFAQHFIERNKEGIIAFINPHGYLDDPTFRGMRWNLLKSFDKIFTLDLHGDAKKKETCPDGSKDENVFDIMQGVSINFFIKTGKKGKDELGKVFHQNLYGTRQAKYDFLDNATIESVNYKELSPRAPMYFFIPKDFGHNDVYNHNFFGVNELFVEESVGIVTTKDDFVIANTPEEAKARLVELISLNEEELRKRYNLKDSSDWSIKGAKEDVGPQVDTSKIVSITYRPFDKRFLYYSGKAKGLVARSRYSVLHHLLKPNNPGLIIGRQGKVVGKMEWNLAFVTSGIVDFNTYYRGGGCVFPLYLIRMDMGEETIVPNFNSQVLSVIEDRLCEKINPQELFDYIYAVLYSHKYRETFAEFLNVDFPRIPYPIDREKYHMLASKGAELRTLHLMDGVLKWDKTVSFPIKGDGIITMQHFDEGKVWINEKQFFGGVSEIAWNYYIGGYQPAQKWLKDRRGQKIEFEEINHYRHIIYILDATSRLMAEIDEIGVL